MRSLPPISRSYSSRIAQNEDLRLLLRYGIHAQASLHELYTVVTHVEHAPLSDVTAAMMLWRDCARTSDPERAAARASAFTRGTTRRMRETVYLLHDRGFTVDVLADLAHHLSDEADAA